MQPGQCAIALLCLRQGQGSGCRVYDLEFIVWSLEFGVKGLGFRGWALGIRVHILK